MGTAIVLLIIASYCGYVGYKYWIKKESCCGEHCHCAMHPQQKRKKVK